MPLRTRLYPAAALCLPLLAGCIPVGYAYPTMSYVPSVKVGAAADEVHAFRVDVADDQNVIDFPDEDRYVLEPMTLFRGGRTFPQLKVAVDYGWVWNCIALIYTGHTHHTMMVRLYRPGWQTVEIQSWQTFGQADWKPAPDAAAQEEAVDRLVSTWETDVRGWRRQAHESLDSEKQAGGAPKGPRRFECLAPGSASRSHRRALLFAASEYERVAALDAAGGPDAKARARLADKAKALRELAGK